MSIDMQHMYTRRVNQLHSKIARTQCSNNNLCSLIPNNCKFNQSKISVFNSNLNAFNSQHHFNLMKCNLNKIYENPRRVKKNKFTFEEDEYLKSLVDLYGQNSWEIIVECMQKEHFNRNIRQCKERYIHYLDPNLINDKAWSKEEDDYLIQCVNEQGTKWKMLERFFPGRTEVSLRNRHKLLLRKINREQKKMLKKSYVLSNSFSFLDSFHEENIKKNVSEMSQCQENTENGIEFDCFPFFNEGHDIFEYDEFSNK